MNSDLTVEHARREHVVPRDDLLQVHHAVVRRGVQQHLQLQTILVLLINLRIIIYFLLKLTSAECGAWRVTRCPVRGAPYCRKKLASVMRTAERTKFFELL